MKHVLFGLLVLWLALLGTFVLASAAFFLHTIPVVSGVVGGGCILLAVTFAVPLRIKVALETVAPYLPKSLGIGAHKDG
jgi:hypothetical protein